MRALKLIILTAPIFCFAPAHADQVPDLDVAKSCRQAQNYGATDDPQQTFKNCMLDEKEAKDQLVKKWSGFKASDRRSCAPQLPSQSYVEMLTCLEMYQQNLMPYSAAPGGAAPPSYNVPHGSPPPRPAPSAGPRGL
ncbi:MAG TPA: hypothetical protein VKV77_11615 [Methylovirgula sp.]|nr:hypothetical protein [Methylovirgula sp.]